MATYGKKGRRSRASFAVFQNRDENDVAMPRPLSEFQNRDQNDVAMPRPLSEFQNRAQDDIVVSRPLSQFQNRDQNDFGMPRARPLSQIGEEASLQSSDSVDELSAFSRHNTPGFISVGPQSNDRHEHGNVPLLSRFNISHEESAAQHSVQSSSNVPVAQAENMNANNRQTATARSRMSHRRDGMQDSFPQNSSMMPDDRTGFLPEPRGGPSAHSDTKLPGNRSTNTLLGQKESRRVSKLDVSSPIPVSTNGWRNSQGPAGAQNFSRPVPSALPRSVSAANFQNVSVRPPVMRSPTVPNLDLVEQTSTRSTEAAKRGPRKLVQQFTNSVVMRKVKEVFTEQTKKDAESPVLHATGNMLAISSLPVTGNSLATSNLPPTGNLPASNLSTTGSLQGRSRSFSELGLRARTSDAPEERRIQATSPQKLRDDFDITYPSPRQLAAADAIDPLPLSTKPEPTVVGSSPTLHRALGLLPGGSSKSSPESKGLPEEIMESPKLQDFFGTFEDKSRSRLLARLLGDQDDVPAESPKGKRHPEHGDDDDIFVDLSTHESKVAAAQGLFDEETLLGLGLSLNQPSTGALAQSSFSAPAIGEGDGSEEKNAGDSDLSAFNFFPDETDASASLLPTISQASNAGNAGNVDRDLYADNAASSVPPMPHARTASALVPPKPSASGVAARVAPIPNAGTPVLGLAISHAGGAVASVPTTSPACATSAFVPLTSHAAPSAGHPSATPRNGDTTARVPSMLRARASGDFHSAKPHTSAATVKVSPKLNGGTSTNFPPARPYDSAPTVWLPPGVKAPTTIPHPAMPHGNGATVWLPPGIKDGVPNIWVPPTLHAGGPSSLVPPMLNPGFNPDISPLRRNPNVMVFAEAPAHIKLADNGTLTRKGSKREGVILLNSPVKERSNGKIPLYRPERVKGWGERLSTIESSSETDSTPRSSRVLSGPLIPDINVQRASGASRRNSTGMDFLVSALHNSALQNNPRRYSTASMVAAMVDEGMANHSYRGFDQLQDEPYSVIDDTTPLLSEDGMLTFEEDSMAVNMIDSPMPSYEEYAAVGAEEEEDELQWGH